MSFYDVLRLLCILTRMVPNKLSGHAALRTVISLCLFSCEQCIIIIPSRGVFIHRKRHLWGKQISVSYLQVSEHAIFHKNPLFKKLSKNPSRQAHEPHPILFVSYIYILSCPYSALFCFYHTYTYWVASILSLFSFYHTYTYGVVPILPLFGFYHTCTYTYWVAPNLSLLSFYCTYTSLNTKSFTSFVTCVCLALCIFTSISLFLMSLSLLISHSFSLSLSLYIYMYHTYRYIWMVVSNMFFWSR